MADTNILNLVSEETFADKMDKLAEAILNIDKAESSDELEKGSITFSGADSIGTLGGAYTGLSEAQLMTHYPFNTLKVKYVQPYATDKSTALSGEDLYLEIPNFWYKVTSSDDGTLKIEISGVKYDEGFSRFVEDSKITKLNLAVYKSYRMDNYFRSVSGYLPTCSVNQSTALSQMPFYSEDGGETFRKAEYQDYRVRGAYNILVMFATKRRELQSLYRGICDYTWNTDVATSLGNAQYSGKSGATDSLGLDVVSGEITSVLSSDDDATEIELTSGKRPFKLLGVENPYGLVWENLYGLVHNSGKVWHYKGTDELSASEITPSDTNTTFEESTIQMATTSGWQKSVASVNGYLVPTSVGGGTNTYNGDYYYYSSGWKISFVGGFLGDSSLVGLFYLRACDGFGNARASVGFRLSFLS